MRIDSLSLSLSSVHLLQEITRVLTRLLNFLNFIDQTNFCEWLRVKRPPLSSDLNAFTHTVCTLKLKDNVLATIFWF